MAETRAKSVIYQIRSRKGVWLTDETQISAEAVDYFSSLFSAEPCTGSWSTLEIIPGIISREQNAELVRLAWMEEMKEVVFAMDGESVVGPNGFTNKFFTFAWDVVSHDVFEAVVSFFYGHELPRSIASTLIVLLPKVSSPQDFSQFRPISLCNFVNEVISKILVAQLAKVLLSIIFPQQSGFVKGRQIFDNFLLAQELVSDIHRNNRGGNVVLKLDMAKTYDRVSWPFLLQVLRRFGFGEVWIDMIWRLILNVWFSVIVNGASQGFFKSSCGLRQRDPISLVLFVISAEVLSRLLNTLSSYRGLTPFRVPLGCLPVTHLAYADDIIIFSSGLPRSVRLAMKALDAYVSVLGQKVNQQKSCVLAHVNFPRIRKRSIAEMTRFQSKKFPVKYMDCLLYAGQRKRCYFAGVCDLVMSKVLSWKGRLLSHGGKLALIKSVLSSMPIHTFAASTPSQVDI